MHQNLYLFSYQYPGVQGHTKVNPKPSVTISASQTSQNNYHLHL